MRIISLSYNCIGGVYTSQTISKTLKYAWATYNFTIIFIIFCVIPTFYSVFINSHETLDFTTFIEAFMAISYITLKTTIFPLITIYYYIHTETAMKSIARCKNTKIDLLCENENVIPLSVKVAELKFEQSKSFNRNNDDASLTEFLLKLNSKKLVLTMVTFAVADIIIQRSLHLISNIYKGESQLPKYYTALVHSSNHALSQKIFYFTYFLENIFIVGIVSCGIAHNIFFTLFVILMNNISFIYCQRMRCLSKILSEYFEHNKNTNYENSDTVCHYIEKDLTMFIKEYKKLTK